VLIYSYPTAFNPKLTNAFAAVRAVAAEDGRPEFQLLNPIAGVTPTPLDSRGLFQAGEAPDNPTKLKLKTRFCIYIATGVETKKNMYKERKVNRELEPRRGK
jgi:hypothetical protein